MGFPLKDDKVVGPTTTLDFLGIILDTSAMEVRLPDDKVAQLETLLDQWAGRRSCRKRDLLSLIGKLAHACKIVRVGRIFLRQFINYSMKATKLDHWIHLSVDFRADIAWWQAFLRVWNHRSMHDACGGQTLPTGYSPHYRCLWNVGLWSGMGPSLVAMAVGF